MKTSKYYIAFVIWLAAFVWGSIGVYQRFTTGHELANYGSYVPWGLWVSGYIYFIGLSAGAFLLSSMIYVFGLERLRLAGRLALFTAVITLPMALLCIAFDLGHMFRSYEVFTRPNFTSMMTWMVWLYTCYFLLIVLELWHELRFDLSRLREKGGVLGKIYAVFLLGWKAPTDPDKLEKSRAFSRKSLKILGGFGIPLAISFHGGVGALFATVAAKDVWHTGLFPILFLTGALVSGGALLMAMIASTSFPDRKAQSDALALMAKIVLGLLAFDVLLEWAELSIPMWYRIGPEYKQLSSMLFGDHWYVFWIFHILLGTVIPAFLMLFKAHSRVALATAGSLIAATFLAVRLNLVIPAQLTPEVEGLQDAYVDARLQFAYTPSAYEWSIIAFVVALGFLLLYLGKRWLPLIAKPTLKTESH